MCGLPAWPYPKFCAHRGAGKLAPENTLAAFRLGYEHGYRMAGLRAFDLFPMTSHVECVAHLVKTDSGLQP